jgi:hypothetical protein
METAQRIQRARFNCFRSCLDQVSFLGDMFPRYDGLLPAVGPPSHSCALRIALKFVLVIGN